MFALLFPSLFLQEPNNGGEFFLISFFTPFFLQVRNKVLLFQFKLSPLDVKILHEGYTYQLNKNKELC